MKSLCDMDTIQIELTDACRMSCSNCTRFCGHKKPWYLSEEDFKNAVDSMNGYPQMVGFMGGEPLLHPKFKEFCEYAQTKIPKEQLGLWTALPKGHEDYAELICQTFDHIFINDHTRSDIFHAPILVSSKEIFKDLRRIFYVADKCWLQNAWSASITHKGAFFCEIAASLSTLFDGSNGWKVEPGWWWKTPKDYTAQIEEFCPQCGVCAPLKRRRSVEGIDDISPENYERLKDVSLKIKRGDYVIHDLSLVTQEELEKQPMAAYKDFVFRSQIAAKYNISLSVNEKKFVRPHYGCSVKLPNTSIFEEYKEKYGGHVNV